MEQSQQWWGQSSSGPVLSQGEADRLLLSEQRCCALLAAEEAAQPRSHSLTHLLLTQPLFPAPPDSFWGFVSYLEGSDCGAEESCGWCTHLPPTQRRVSLQLRSRCFCHHSSALLCKPPGLAAPLCVSFVTATWLLVSCTGSASWLTFTQSKAKSLHALEACH